MTNAQPARPSLLDRALAAYPLAAAFLALLFLYAFQTTRHPAPWLFLDELKWTALSRSFAHTGHAQLRLQPVSFDSLYTFFIAPAWLVGSATGTGYAAAKYLNAFVMTAAIFPVYALARLFVPRRPALVAAIVATATPAFAYTGMLIPEPLAYFWSALTLWLVARALLRPGRATVAFAVGAVVIAPLVRSQLAVLAAAALVALAIVLATSERARAVRSRWSVADRLRALFLLLGGGIAVNALLIQRSSSWQVGTHFHHRLWTYGLWAIGAFAIGVGLLPVLLTLAWALHARLATREDRVLFAVLLGTTASFAIYTAVKASYLSTVFAIRVEERNLIYLSPVLFVVCARWFVDARRRVLGVAVAAAALWYLIDSTPYNLDTRFYSDAPGLAILAWFNRTFYLTSHDVRWVLLGVLAFSVAVALAVPQKRRLRGARAVAGAVGVALVAGLVLAWNLTGEIAAANGSNAAARAELTGLPKPPNFVDRVTGGKRAMFFGSSLGDGHAVLSLELWNRSIQDVWSADGSAPPLGPTVTPNFSKPDGTVSLQLPLDWGVFGAGVGLEGRTVASNNGLSVVRLSHPIRITHEVSGVTADGWMGRDGTFGQYTGGRGVAVIGLSRTAACGRGIPAARVAIRVSRVRLDVNFQPAAGRLLARRHEVVRSEPCEAPTLRIPVRTPYRIDLHATGLVPKTPYEQRDLSVKVTFAFEPGKRR